ncbi:MAG TPA: hypothetical protein VGF99_17265 [Myxococcota bacterium]
MLDEDDDDDELELLELELEEEPRGLDERDGAGAARSGWLGVLGGVARDGALG